MSETPDRTSMRSGEAPAASAGAASRSSVVAAVLLDAVPEWDRVTAMLAPGNLEAAAFRHRVVEVPIGLDATRRNGDHDDTPWHLDRVSLTGTAGFSDVLSLSPTVPETIDLHRPSWGLTLVDGLTGGQAALVISIVRPERNGHGTPAQNNGEQHGSVWSWLRSLSEHTAEAIRSSTGLVVDSTTELVKAIVAPTSQPLPQRAIPPGGPHRLHTLDIPGREMRDAVDRAGCGLESGVAAAVLLGYASYRHTHGSPADDLFAAIPGTGSEEPAQVALGGIEIDDGPVALMQRIDRVSAGMPDDPSVLPATRMFGHDDVLTCTVPGSATTLFIAGAGIARYYGFGRTLGSAINATLMSYRDMCCVGLTVDPAAVPDHKAFDECLRSGLRTVLDS
ncbi:WS/DGAT domain-containing protein [Rhodococcus artemisiae]|uniref:WS/DGAT domain-containing protein n=1 Tax=Rhodococcus artemisiae TaxID=714159 RepID=A0ABU7L6T1_9NOCA|nr:WS/DGAT domain-containing protein [Rhodococcus artemisiae]MEE2056622.1 WS/DGAT domain-containing protein [Rhodococcus artemisiae]